MKGCGFARFVRFGARVMTVWCVVALLSLAGGSFVYGDIALRNAELKVPEGDAVAAAASGFSSWQAGELRILVFKDALTDEVRQSLKQQGIIPLRYVPDHAWICRIQESPEVRTADVGAGFQIEWSCVYEPEYRLYKGLTCEKGWNLSGTPKSIRVVLAEDVSPEDIDAIAAEIHATSISNKLRGGVFLSGSATGAVLQKLSHNPNVLWVEPTVKFKPAGEVAAKIVEGDNPNAHPTYLQSLGYDGSGVVTAVADTGLDTGNMKTLHLDLRDQVKALYYYGDVNSARDEFGHGTHVSGSIVADGQRGYGTINEDGYLYGLGTAPGAQLVGQRVIDSTGTLFLTEDFQLLARDACREGVSVVNNSWGAEESGRYDSYAAEYDALVRDSDNQTAGNQEMAYVFAAGNSGPGTQTLITPGVGKNVITVGASQSDRQVMYIYEDGIDAMADFSSRGPTEDGRYKPDIVAPGTWISSTKSSVAPEGNEWLGIDEHYTYMGGTSMASPIVTGCAAVLIQYFREMCAGQSPSPALLKALLISCAEDMDDNYGTTPTPNYNEGWGRIYLPDLIQGSRIYLCENQSVLLKQGQQWERKVFLKNGDEPLRVTLAYTDVPGLPSAVPALVNDLDLVVTAPDGSVYYGNQFSKGTSITGSSPDRLNNVEGFYLENPVPGIYSVVVQAYRIAEDARIDTEAVDQDFSLVISGNLVVDSTKNLICLDGSQPTPLPSQGLLFTDRNFYTAPDKINVLLYDPDLSQSETVSVMVTSGSFPQGRKVTLEPVGDFGFCGSLRTSDALADLVLDDDMIPVLNGETITVFYEDANPVGTITATAIVDMVPPVIGEPESWFSYGKITLYVKTDTLARVTLHYGVGTEIDRTLSLQTYDTESEFVLSGLEPGDYNYWFEATDQAGNTSTNDNKGAYFVFAVEKSASILLVDTVTATGSSDGGEWGFDVTPPPLSGYADPLDQLGYKYEIWSALEMGSLPELEDLIAYNVVIWRVNDLAYLDLTTTVIIPAEGMSAIIEYVKQGGAFFLSSMEILSYGTAAFQSQVLHVGSFVEDVEASVVNGVSGNPIGNGINLELDYSNHPRLESFYELGPDLSDSITPAENALICLNSEKGGVGVHYPASTTDTTAEGGRTVFFSFPIDAIPMEGEGVNTRAEVFRRVLQFLCPGLDGNANLAFGRAAYTIPSLAVIEVADTDLMETDKVIVSVYAGCDTNAVRTVELLPTVYSSVFRGTIPIRNRDELESDNAGDALFTQDEDIIYATYFDESFGRINTTFAVIDTVAPVISLTEIELDYMDGIVSWQTDEEADSLVEFGETPNLGRTVYDALYRTEHSLTITGLLPDRDYYFRITSRDVAFNAGMDDNAGELYLFHTPAPLEAPWVEDFEVENSYWLTMSDSSAMDWGSPSVWERGIPSDAAHDIVPGAYSGKYCYGVNLEGSVSEISIASLFSPAVYLDPSSDTAELSFMTAYNMMIDDDHVILHAGELSISTNNGVNWTVLLSFKDESTYGEWEEITVDISKWIGNTVRFQWYYNYMTIGGDQIPGWYIDDVSVTTSQSVLTGMVRVESNLSAATWQLTSDELDLSGGGLSCSTNLPSGCDYTVTWGDLPWYVTPKAEKQTLNDGQKSISFNGEYRIVDENMNEISDEWEMYFFGKLLGKSGAFLDEDQDGLCNLAEFVAGTDPLNPESNLRFEIETSAQHGKFALTWFGVKGKTYRVYSSANLADWEATGEPIRADADQMLTMSLAVSDSEQQYYRLEVTP